MTGSQLDELMTLGRGTPLPAAELPPLHELVARLARTKPDHVAVCSAGSAFSYGELDDWASRVAGRLGEEGVGLDSRVGILARPSAAMVAALLGVLRRGAAYVPVDPTEPDRRIAEILTDAGADAVVIAGDGEARSLELGLPVIRADSAVNASPGAAALVPVAAEDVAYVIYTSGSTGEPKGVVVEHGQIAASTLARLQVYPGAGVYLLVSPLAFDSSVAGLWSTLSSGGRLVVATADEVRDPERLVELIEREQVTRTLCIPSFYSVLLDAAERLGIERLRSLETVIVAGEPLPEALVERHFALHSRPVALFNECGATETSVWATCHRFDAPGPVSIGGPIPGASLYVLDDSLRLVPRAEEGELYIGGAVVARGYLGRPEATKKAFLPDPFAGVAGARMYRTGDVVRWNDAGTLDYLGRRDHQIKIRGRRVELGAVEAALRTLPTIRDAAVLADDARTRLTAFVVAPAVTSAEAVREQLADLLPAVMIPTRIEVLDGLPLTFSGKVDRRKLQAQVDAEPRASAPAAATDGSIASRVAAAWAEVLDLPDVEADVNFFDLGGHSLTMFQLQDALERHTGVRPSIVDLFRYPSVSSQVALVEEGGRRPGDAPREAREEDARRGRAARLRRQRVGHASET